MLIKYLIALLAMLIFAVPSLAHANGISEADLSELERGVALIEKGSIMKSLKIFRELTEKSPGMLEAWHYLGVVNVKLERWDEAIRYLERALKLDSGSLASRYQLALAQFSIGLKSQAKANIHMLLEVDQEFPQALFLLASILGDEGDKEGEIKHLKRALLIDHRFFEAQINLAIALMEIGRLNEAGVEASGAMDLDPSSAEAVRVMAIILERQGDGDGAATLLRRLSNEHPDDPEPMLAMGEYYFSKGLMDMAAIAFEKGCKLGDPSAECFYNLGATYQVLEQWDDASRAFERAAKLTPTDSGALFHLAQVLSRAGNHDREVEVYRTLLENDPDHADALYNLSLQLEAQGETKDAARLLKRIVGLEPSNTAARMSLGLLLERNGELAQAAEQYNKALEYSADDVDILLALALVNHRLGETEAALEQYQSLMDSRPDDARVHYGAGLILRAQGKLLEAIKAQETATSLVPGMGDAWLELGRALDQSDSWENAAAAYSKAIELGAGDQLIADLGRVLYLSGAPGEAIPLLRRAIKVKGTPPAAHYFLGMSLMKIEGMKSALPHLEKAVKLAPENHWLALELALMLSKLERCEEALPYYEAALESQEEQVRESANKNRARCLGVVGNKDSLDILLSGTGPLEDVVARQAGAKLFSLKDYKGAAEILARAAPSGEEIFPIEFMLGYSLHKLGQHDEALVHLLRAKDEDPNHYDTHKALAAVLDAQGLRGEAAKELEIAASLAPDKGAADRKSLGKVYLGSGDKVKAAASLKKAHANTPEDVETALFYGRLLESQGDRAGAIKVYTQSLKKAPRSGQLLARRGDCLVRLGQLDPGSRDLEAAIKAGVKDARTFEALGVAQARLGRFKRAAKSMERAVLLAPENTQTKLTLARILVQAGLSSRGLAVALELYKAQPGKQEVLFLVVKAAHEANRYQDVVRYGMEFGQRYPGKEPNILKITAAAALKTGKPEIAIQALKALVDAGIEEAEVLEDIGQLYLDQGDSENAEAYFMKALSFEAGSHQSLMGLGAIMDKAEKPQEAAKYYQRATVAAPEDPYALYNLAVALSNFAQSDETISALERCIKVDKKFAACYHALGLVHISAGDPGKAKPLIKTLKRLDPELAKDLKSQL
jgi:tetratricopeptide (TPR) repeat protein